MRFPNSPYLELSSAEGSRRSHEQVVSVVAVAETYAAEGLLARDSKDVARIVLVQQISVKCLV